MHSVLRVTRPHQWVKNVTCFAGLLFSGGMFQPAKIASASLAFGVFCLMASAVYIFNDYVDQHADRLNPRTAGRPLASGAIPVWIALVVSVFFGAVASLGALALGRSCGLVMAAYVVMNIGYSLRFKRTVIADVMCIALGFVLRVLFGVYAVQAVPSPWIIVCMFSLALFLGFGKRRAELNNLGSEAAEARLVLSKYTPAYIDLVFGITATITILTYTLFAIASYHDATMVVTIVPVVYCVLRYAYKVMVEGAGQSPEALFVEDRMLWVGTGTWLVLCVLILYAGLRAVEFPHP